MKSNILKQLKEYVANTPKEQINKDWEEIDAMGFTGPTVDEFIENQKKHDIMTQETTQLEKAIAIAKKDGWMHHISVEDWYHHPKHCRHDAQNLLESYLTDLNYLMPLAVKVLHTKELYNRAINNKTFFDTYWMLKNTYDTLVIDPNNQYTELFNALYNAIKLLENE